MKKCSGITFLLALCLLAASCGWSSNRTSSGTPSSQPAGAVFVTAEDAPLASVVGFDVTINSITLKGNNGSPQVETIQTTGG
jgi:hypothetical protein